MSTSGEISKSQKTKLSLQRKVIKPCTDLVDIIKQPSLNETCEFRSVEKMQKFFSSSESQSKEDGMRKGKSTRRNLINKNSAKAPKNEKSKKKVQIKTEMLKDTESSNAVLLNQPSCSTLNNKVTEDLEDTVKIENKIEKTKNQNEADESNVIEIDCEEDDKPGSKGKCLACGKDDIDSQDMATHLQTCLKSRFQRGKSQAESEDEVAEQGVKSADPKVEQEECFFCQICQKDLSKMNSHRRTQHLNRCIDKNEEEQNIKDLEKKALEHAKTAVLDCPMCGKPCKTENARKVHVKKCGQQLKVSTDQVLKLMKKQEEEHQMLIAAGILPKSTLSKLKGKERSSSISTKTKKTSKEPKSQFDADLQMAMAISISESKPVDKPEPKKNKKKKGLTGDPAMLVAMTKEEKKRRLSMRVTNMLVPEEEECSDIDLTPEFARSGIEDKYLSQTEQIPSLWNKCSLQSENKENWKKETYYVDCLVPPLEVSKVKAGSKLKRMSEIPGRDTSFIRPKTPIKTPVVRISRNNTISESGDTQEEMLVASTQTAVVLAELAADSSQLSVPDFDCSGFCPEQPINIQPIQNTDLLGGLQKSMLSLVNSSSHADVQIHTIGGDIVFCHKVILSCRCQSILKYEEGGHIYMEDMASDAVISIMKYVYGGLVSVTQSCLSDVVKLADRTLPKALEQKDMEEEVLYDFDIDETPSVNEEDEEGGAAVVGEKKKKRRNLVKVLILGGIGVGKTSLMNQYSDGTFNEKYKVTIGADFIVKEVPKDTEHFTLQVWDTPETFKHLESVLEEFLANAFPEDEDNFPYIVIGNKIDKENRLVTKEEAMKWCKKNGNIPYMETSAKDGTNVEEAFMSLVDSMSGTVVE
ncbi:RAB7A [Mytilus edulis]|uniref:RAB7A n=1 Tax=Mytilus edulis TaxID=6550 RepID=A0A8S3QUU5_MYTED|nr:RAB7A [Mytilus edulis]